MAAYYSICSVIRIWFSAGELAKRSVLAEDCSAKGFWSLADEVLLSSYPPSLLALHGLEILESRTEAHLAACHFPTRPFPN
jgi:hypothetical protein